MKVIQGAIKANWPELDFTASYPKVKDTQSVSTPIITYQLELKKPADVNGVKEIKPRLRETIKVPEQIIETMDESFVHREGAAMEVWGQMFDYYIDFNVYGSNADEADEAADRLQQFMFKYTGYLMKLGVLQIVFEELRNNPGEKNKANIPCRTVSYMFRIDEIVGAKVPHIENIIIETSIIDDALARMVDIYVQGVLDSFNKEKK